MSGPYGAILADPAWTYRDPAKAGRRGVAFKYATMPTDEIAALDVQALAAPDCALFLWATPPTLPDALFVLDAWGFDYSTIAFCWVKTAPDAVRARALPVLEDIQGCDCGCTRRTAHAALKILALENLLHPGLAWGMGQSTRANVELVLLGIRGRLGRISGGVHQVVFAPPGRHSAKPAEVRDRIVKLLGDRPRIELFARERVEGWDAWGDDPAIGTPDVDLQRRVDAPRDETRQLALFGCAP